MSTEITKYKNVNSRTSMIEVKISLDVCKKRLKMAEKKVS